MKVAIVIGHHKKSKGAYSEYFKMYEWDFYNEVVENIDCVEIFQHDYKIKSYTERIKATAKKLNDFDIVIETHFNSAVPQANGCETLYYFNSKKGKMYAQLFSVIVNDITGIKLRNNGLKALINKNDRGFASVYYPKPPTILIEPFFGSNEKDCLRIGTINEMSNIIIEFLDNL